MKIYKFLILFLFLNFTANADITEEFPSYKYVFVELGVKENYIYNRDFQNFIYKNKRAFKKRYINAIRRGGLIIPTMRELMYQQDISPLFIYLSMVESAFKTEAKSSSAAGGLWQFMPTTGKEQRLHINQELDERYDPIKSTIAAVDYLYKIRGNLDKWYLAAMAYNCGAGCVRDSINLARTDDLATLIEPRNNYIRKETRDYIKKILLFALIGENYLFNPRDDLGEMMFRINRDRLVPVKLRAGERLGQIASTLGMDYRVLKNTNMHLKNDIVPYRGNAMVNIPMSKYKQYLAQYQGIQEYQTADAYNRGGRR